MKLMILGDRHFTDRKPEKRLDENYFETQLGKFRQEIKIYREKGCDAMLQPGDFFDSPNVSNYVIATLIKLLRKEDIMIHCVSGQHDVVGHSMATLRRSPLKVLEAAGVVKIVGQDGIRMSTEIKVDLFGCSYGCEIPQEVSNDGFNILLIHAMIGDKELYPGQDMISPQKFAKDNNQFGLTICGDYHYTFCTKKWAVCEGYNNCVVNAGCLVRKSVAEKDLAHKPCVFIYDTSNESCEKIELKVASINTVFDLTEVEKKENSELMKFIETLRDSSQSLVTWYDVLLKVYKEKKTNENVKKVIDECLVEVRR